MWIKAKMKRGGDNGKRSEKREISKEERYATPFDGASEAVKRGEEEKQNMPLTKCFAQAFLKFDAWFESMRGDEEEKRIPKTSAEEGRYTNTQTNRR